jgi:tRNA threonylcarbamoyladenosine biosynthesis protein TsaB
VDARVHEIYHAAYERREDQWLTVHEPSLCSPDAAPELPGSGWLGAGSGFNAYRQALEARYADVLGAIEPEGCPHARDIAALAAPRFAAGQTLSADRAAPLYLRDKVALRIDERATR